jgi:hypothetical protein
MPRILGTRVDPSGQGNPPGLDITVVIEWNNSAEASADYDLEFRFLEDDEVNDDELPYVHTAPVGRTTPRSAWVVSLFPFFFRPITVPTPIRFIFGKPANWDWNTELGDDEIYMRVSLVARGGGPALDTATTRFIQADW